MSANINSMMYTGETPWHGLGKKLDNAATSAEAIAAAGLNWSVEKRLVYTTGPLGKLIQIDGKYAVSRMDNDQPLGVVGDVYHPLQNKDAFRFFDAVVGLKEAFYHTAGALGAGEVIWILAKLNGIIQVKGHDITEKYLLLTNRHDGLGSVRIMFTPIRVVCQNTLNLALADGTKFQAKLKHCATMGMKVQEVREALGIIDQKFAFFEKAAQRLAAVELTQEAFKNYLGKVGIIPEDLADLEGRAKTMAENVIHEVTQKFEHGRGNDMPGVKGTLWAAFNGVTEYVDYTRTTRGGSDSRAKSLLFGSGATLKQKAWDEALSLAGQI
jgi:phage/plasmid-like protein (TIGR03299 family)